MRKFSEKDIRKLELLSTVTALLLAVFCVIYLFDSVRNSRMLYLLLVLGIILYLMEAFIDIIRQCYCRMLVSAGMFLICASVLMYLI